MGRGNKILVEENFILVELLMINYTKELIVIFGILGTKNPISLFQML